MAPAQGSNRVVQRIEVSNAHFLPLPRFPPKRMRIIKLSSNKKESWRISPFSLHPRKASSFSLLVSPVWSPGGVWLRFPPWISRERTTFHTARHILSGLKYFHTVQPPFFKLPHARALGGYLWPKSAAGTMLRCSIVCWLIWRSSTYTPWLYVLYSHRDGASSYHCLT